MTSLVDQRERERIRSALDETLVVEAAAGTGKTTELVRRMVAILASGSTSVDRIVAVTFTEKAAGELKLRLRTELERERQRAASDDPRRGRLEDALARLEEARVGTIHGFCGDLIRERSVDAGVDPEFETMAEPEARRLFQEAFDLWLQETLESPGEGVRRSLRRTAARGRRPLGPRNGTDVDEDGPVSRLLGAALALSEWRDFRTPWRRESFEREAEIDALVERLHAFAELTERCAQPERDNFHRDTVLVRRVSRELTVTEEASGRDYDALEALLVELSRERALTQPRKGYGKAYGADLPREDVHRAREEVLTRLLEFAEAADADLAALLQGELFEAVDRYGALKRKTGRLDFVDLLARARDLIRDDALVRREYQARFSHVFIDEFQDTDPLQAELLLLLSADDSDESDWRRVRPVPGKLFVVGDPKQAIYRFRRADVGTYLDVKRRLTECGASVVELTTSFRAVPAIQHAVNRAFGEVMLEDSDAFQAGYVPLAPYREDAPEQSAVIALPVPEPYGTRGVTKAAIQASLPDAVGAFVDWIVNESGWTVTERSHGARVDVAARHVCLLFRRLYGFFEGDITGGYIDALEARGIRHLIVGGRSFHDKEEVEVLRTALAAIEWPDDELSVFATLRGPLFAVGDEALLEYRGLRAPEGTIARFPVHPHRVPSRSDVPEHLHPILDALGVLKELNRRRNHRPIADTIARLLEATRAHARLALRRGGEQALANVLHVADQARRYESTGGISFRGFVERLIDEAKDARTPEAPILEDRSDGVRIMTVHRAKGLEFPIVVLADMTASIAGSRAGRHVDPRSGLAAMRIGNWMPWELHEAGAVELRRDLAEGVRLAYVAATRARDVLVIPAIGEGPGALGRVGDTRERANWTAPLTPAIFPPTETWRDAEIVPGAPRFGRSSIIRTDDPTIVDPPCVVPGRHAMDGYDVTWWDPHVLERGKRPSAAVRRDLQRLIARKTPDAVVEVGRRAYDLWRDARDAARLSGSVPSVEVVTATSLAAELADAPDRSAALDPAAVALVSALEGGGVPARPSGKRFGALVHAVLASVPFEADRTAIERVAGLEARMLGASDDERSAAVDVAERVLAHPILAEARAATEVRREVTITSLRGKRIVDGIVDLAYRSGDEWVVVDFKTDAAIDDDETYRLQVATYVEAVADATGSRARGVLLRV